MTPGEEAVKIRNALVADVGDPADFDWVPGSAPASFKSNQAEPSASVPRHRRPGRRDADPGQPGCRASTSRSRSRAHLMASAASAIGGPIQAGLDETYRRITTPAAGLLRRLHPRLQRPRPGRRTAGAHLEHLVRGIRRRALVQRDLRRPAGRSGSSSTPFHSLYFVDDSDRRTAVRARGSRSTRPARTASAGDRPCARSCRRACRSGRTSWPSTTTAGASGSWRWCGATMSSTTTSRRRCAGAAHVSRSVERAAGDRPGPVSRPQDLPARPSASATWTHCSARATGSSWPRACCCLSLAVFGYLLGRSRLRERAARTDR